MPSQEYLIDNRKKGWFWDYNDIFRSSLSEHATIVRLFLACCANKDREAWPSLNTIARMCKISKPTAIKAVRELESQGWIRRSIRKNNDEYDNTVYYLEDPPEAPAGCEAGGSPGTEGGSKASLPPGKKEDEGVVKPVDHLVNTVDHPSKAGLPGVVKPVDSNNTHITIPNKKDQQQRSISDHGSIVDRSDHEKAVVVDSANQINYAEAIINYALRNGFDIAEDCARDLLAAAGGIERARAAVDRAKMDALSKVRRGEKIRNPAGMLFSALTFNAGAKVDLDNLDGRKRRMAEKEEKYQDIYLS